MPIPHGPERLAPLVACIAAFGPGCRTAADWSAQADERAAEIIEQGQRDALGRAEPFSIERPSETFRRRLMVEQGLPVSAPESLSAADAEPLEFWPEDDRLQGRGDDDPLVLRLADGGFERDADGALRIGLEDALQIAAHNSREYQQQKEQVFQAALQLDLARNDFRTIFAALLTGDLTSDLAAEPVRTRTTALRGSAEASLSRLFQNGVSLTGRIGIDLVRLLTPPRVHSRGIFADSSITIPLARGAARYVVAEPLVQAESDVLSAILAFDRFRRTFAVQVASEYLSVLQQSDRVRNARQNYESLVLSARQLRRLARAGRRPEIEVDQAVQNELQARDSWIRAIQGYQRALENFRVTLGLPPDARIVLDRTELDRLGEDVRARLEVTPESAEEALASAQGGAADEPVELPPPGLGRRGALELDEERAVRIALENRKDLLVAASNLYDAKRRIAVAADALGAEVTLLGSGNFGSRRTGASSALLPDSDELRYDQASYEALLTIDLPIERTAERNAYRNAWIAFERAVRDYQEQEDRIKLEVRQRLRDLLEAREALRIELAAVRLAERRVASTKLFLDAGRAQARDLLEAQEDLLAAQNNLTSALVAYRVAELELQRDMGVLEIGPDGLWTEFVPDARQDEEATDAIP